MPNSDDARLADDLSSSLESCRELRKRAQDLLTLIWEVRERTRQSHDEVRRLQERAQKRGEVQRETAAQMQARARRMQEDLLLMRGLRGCEDVMPVVWPTPEGKSRVNRGA